MFAGRRRRSSNIRVMQLFHELKQQFPTVPDHVVSACIATHAHSTCPDRDATIREYLEAAALNHQPQPEPMGRPPPPPPPPSPSHQQPETPTNPPPEEAVPGRRGDDMDESGESGGDGDINRNLVSVKSAGVTFSKKFESVSVCTANQTTTVGKSSFYAKRPDRLDIRPETFGDFPNTTTTTNTTRHNIQLSEKCKDVHKLLNSEKPPRSPLSHKRLSSSAAKSSPTRVERSPLASPDAQKRLQQTDESPPRRSTPTQTTDTLLGGGGGGGGGGVGGGGVNLSLNVNCSMDVVHSPTAGRRKSVLQVTPQQPWLQEPASPRSYTSVNLTLRPPSSEPQPPIDITSRNSSLTYSTSSFDSQKGLQSRLQITVGPGGGSVSATRTRPRSSYHPQDSLEEVVPYRAGSLNNLAATSEPPVILKQQARIERLRIELRSEKAKLQIMQNEVSELEDNRLQAPEQKTDAEVEKQLRREIKHLQYQCEQLALEADKSAPVDMQHHDDFYHTIYRGQRGPLNIDVPRPRRAAAPPLPHAVPMEAEGPKWNCHLCTFLNHPDLDKCEQCEMPRILHGKSPPGPRFNNGGQPTSYPTNYNPVPSYSFPGFPGNGREQLVITRPIGFLTDNLNYQNLNNNVPQFTRPN